MKKSNMVGTTPRETLLKLVHHVEEWKPDEWYPMSIYSENGKAAGAFHKEVLGLDQDPGGIYFFRARQKIAFQTTTGIPLKRSMFYIGRAGQISRRLNRHLQVVNQNSASLIYKITAQSLKRTDRTRVDNMNDMRVFVPKFEEYQCFLRNNCEMAYFPCENDEEQALLEIIFWLRFKTQFNEWRTH